MNQPTLVEENSYVNIQSANKRKKRFYFDLIKEKHDLTCKF